MIGEAIAHFRITAKLGEGGMGEVYRAIVTKLESARRSTTGPRHYLAAHFR